MPPATVIPDAQMVRDILAYHQTHSIADTAQRFGVSERRTKLLVRDQAHRGGTRVWLLDPELVADVVSKWKVGMTKKELAAELGVTRHTITRILRRSYPRSYRPGTGRYPRNQGYGGSHGRVINALGYAVVRVPPSHPFYEQLPPGNGLNSTLGKYVFEHRLVMAEHLGRPLRRHETVHHINGKRADNRIENLQLRTSHHGPGIVMVCARCGSSDLRSIPIEKVKAGKRAETTPDDGEKGE